jgi:excisionase family DNA binding protein
MGSEDPTVRDRQGDEAPALPGWIGLAEAARLAGVSTMTIIRLVRSGDLPFAATPVGRLFPEAAVAAYRRTNRAPGKRLSGAHTPAVVRTDPAPRRASDGTATCA